MDKGEMPVGFSMALAMNPEAMEAFARLDQAARGRVLERSRRMNSSDDMRRLIDEIITL